MTKRSGLTLKNNTILHATQDMYKRRIVKVGALSNDMHLDASSRVNNVGNFKYIRAVDYWPEQTKFRNVSGSG